MKRRQFLTAAGVGAAASVIAAPAIAQANPEIKWRMTCSWPKSLETLYGAADTMAKRLRKQLTISFRSGVCRWRNRAGASSRRRRANGTVECGHTASYYYFGKIRPSRSAPRSVWPQCAAEPGLGRMAAVLRRSTNSTKSITPSQSSPVTPAARWAAGFRKEINSVDDLKGLKFRIGGFTACLAAPRVVPQQIGAPTSIRLSKKARSTRLMGGPMTMKSSASTKSPPNYYYPGWWEGGSMLHAFINLDKYNALPKHYQAILQHAGAFANTSCMAKYDQLTAGVAPAACQRVKLKASRRDHGSLLQGNHGLHGEISRKTPLQKVTTR